MSQSGDESASPPSSPEHAGHAGQTPGALLHRIRSPLTAIIGFADVLSRNVERGATTPEVLRDRLDRIKSAAQRIDALLDALGEALRPQG